MEEDFFGSNKEVTITLSKAEAVSLAMSYIMCYKNTDVFVIADKLCNKILTQIAKQ